MRTTILAAVTLLLTSAMAFSAPSARSARAVGCSQVNKLPTVFPSATTVGFGKRATVKGTPARAPIWPGWCGRKSWWTTYSTSTGSSVDVRVALFASAHDVEAALAEPAYGPVRVLPNGSRVRGSSPSPVNVNGVPSLHTGAASAYRNLFISSTSIASTPVPVAAQLRLHRAIQTAFRSLR